MEAKANWDRTFGLHSLGALALYYMEDVHNTQWKYDAMGINAIPQRRQNLSGRVSYGYNNCYFIDANFGYTGSAQFEKGKRFGFFPIFKKYSNHSSYFHIFLSFFDEKIPFF